MEKKAEQEEKLKTQEELIRENGQIMLTENPQKHRILLLNIIGEIEGHECLSANLKTTKYEHVLPQLASIEDSREVDGLMILINTVGGDVEIVMITPSESKWISKSEPTVDNRLLTLDKNPVDEVLP